MFKETCFLQKACLQNFGNSGTQFRSTKEFLKCLPSQRQLYLFCAELLVLLYIGDFMKPKDSLGFSQKQKDFCKKCRGWLWMSYTV